MIKYILFDIGQVCTNVGLSSIPAVGMNCLSSGRLSLLAWRQWSGAYCYVPEGQSRIIEPYLQTIYGAIVMGMRMTSLSYV